MTGVLNLLMGTVRSAVVTDPYFEYTTLLLPGNGTNGAQNNTFLDGSTNNFTITRNGNTTQGTFSPFSQTGWGNYFNGSTAYLTVASNAAFAFGTGDWTIECWVFVANTSNQMIFIDLRGATSTTVAPLLYMTNTGVVNYFTNGAVQITGSAITANTWNHLAVARSGTSTKLFINGTQAGSTYSDSNSYVQQPVYIARASDSAGSYVNGYMSNVRLVKGTAIYTSNFTPPTAPLTAISGTSLLTCQSNRFIDNSSNAFAITSTGSPSVVAFSPFNPTESWSAATYGGSGYFDGNGDYLTAAQNTAFSLGTGAFTVEAFFYLTSFAATNRIIGLGDGANGGSPTVYTAWSLRVGSGSVDWYRYDGTETVYTATTTVNLNAWNHVVVCRDGSSNLAIFLNGVRVLSQASVTTSYNNVNTNPLYLGRIDDGSGGFSTKYITGYVSNPRIVKGSTVYSPTSTTLTVPTAPLTAITNTSLLLNFTNAGIYDATSKNDLETVGNAQISTTQSKWGGGSMYFDGTGDYLKSNVSTLDLYGFGGDFAIELWLYRNATGQTILVDSRPTGGGGTSAYYVLYVNTSNVLSWFVGGSVRITGTTTISNSTWYYIAIARSGSSTKMYLNGTQEGSTYTDSTALICASGRPYVGADANDLTSNLNGYINDLRITKGNARGYTGSTITVPTAAFPTL